MSRKIVNLKIAPIYGVYHNKPEVFKHGGFECPACNGEGVIPRPSDYLGYSSETDSEICPRCNGYKTLCADIVIRWKPDKPNE